MEVEEGRYWGGSIDRRPFAGCDLLCPSCKDASPISAWTEDEFWCDDCNDTHHCYVCPKCQDYFGPGTGGTVRVIGEPPKHETIAPADDTKPNHVRDAVRANLD